MLSFAVSEYLLCVCVYVCVFVGLSYDQITAQDPLKQLSDILI